RSLVAIAYAAIFSFARDRLELWGVGYRQAQARPGAPAVVCLLGARGENKRSMATARLCGVAKRSRRLYNVHCRRWSHDRTRRHRICLAVAATRVRYAD